MDDSDARVIARSIDEPSAFGTLYDRHAAVLYRFLLRRVGPDVADTLLGDVFRIGFERRSTFDPGRPSTRPWLYGIATNLVARHHRVEARRLRATGELAARRIVQGDLADGVAGLTDAENLWPRVAEAIAGLADVERDALLLFVWEELSYDEISVALGVPVGTVRSRLNRAHGHLRALTDPVADVAEQRRRGW